jgi:hypothetical protein
MRSLPVGPHGLGVKSRAHPKVAREEAPKRWWSYDEVCLLRAPAGLLSAAFRYSLERLMRMSERDLSAHRLQRGVGSFEKDG